MSLHNPFLYDDDFHVEATRAKFAGDKATEGIHRAHLLINADPAIVEEIFRRRIELTGEAFQSGEFV